jgi:hypothetical protein
MIARQRPIALTIRSTLGITGKEVAKDIKTSYHG